MLGPSDIERGDEQAAGRPQQLTEAQAEADSAAQLLHNVMINKAEAFQEFAKKLLQKQQEQQQLTDAHAVADALKLQQQLSDAQAHVDSAQADARKLQKQLVYHSMNAELDDKKEQLAEAKAAAESASADTKLTIVQIDTSQYQPRMLADPMA
ncbi:TPA: hypothetical protein ACH3X1_014472 [Trebouxia sp. C0004]